MAGNNVSIWERVGRGGGLVASLPSWFAFSVLITSSLRIVCISADECLKTPNTWYLYAYNLLSFSGIKVIKKILAAYNFIDSLYSVMAGERSLDGKGKNV